MGLALFIIVAAFTVGGAVGVVATRNVVHAALFLLLSLLGAAGAYLLLFAEFLALVQALIYGGAITIVVLFAVMLTRSSEYPRITDNRQWPLALLAAAALSGVLGAAFWLAPELPAGVGAEPQAPAFTGLAAALFTKWALPFEIASLVLLVALIGAIIIARQQSDTTAGGVPAAGMPAGGGVPTGSTPATGVPATGVSTAGAPSASVPAGSTPTGGVPAAGTPAAGGVPTGSIPAGGVPTVGAPAGGVPAGSTPAGGGAMAESASSAGARAAEGGEE